MTSRKPFSLLLIGTLALSSCSQAPSQALGTLEWDRVSLPAPVAEKIVRIDVREGQQVAAGAALLQLELTRTQRDGEDAFNSSRGSSSPPGSRRHRAAGRCS